MMKIVVGLTLLCLAGLCQQGVKGVAVMSVDLGTEWMKVAIVSPGVPMEIALNKESKRKTPVVVSFRDGERTFGEDAQTVGIRFPQNSYTYLLDLVGKTVDNPMVKLFQKRFPYYNIVPDPVRGTVVFQHDSETTYSVEELIAMIFHKARHFAQTSANQAINEAVLTVPGYFNQAERRAILQAAQLADLKVLQLINDYTAVALNYGIFRRKDFNETAQYVMFYDMGASSTTATVVSYQMVKVKDKGIVETHPQVAILGVGYDRTLGGLEMQLRLRDYLAKKFNEMKKTTKDVFENPRALAKLFKEAGRVKNVLSANADHNAQIEGLLDEIDFKLHVTREEFEHLCSDLFERVKNPVEQALKVSGLSMDIISQVVLVGAGTRVPKVQERLSAAVNMELSKNLNTDEAAVMGAVYKAADLSTGFKVKKFITKDAVIFPIQVLFERETTSEEGSKPVKRMLFGPMNPYPQKKILTFNKHQSDFVFTVHYAELDHIPPHEVDVIGSLNLSSVSLSGVAPALEKHKAPNTESKGIKAHWVLDDSGILSLSTVELVLEKSISPEELEAEESPLSKLGSTISKLFTGPEDSLKEPLEKPVHEEQDESKEAEPAPPKKEEGADGSKPSEETVSGEDKKNATLKDGEKKKPKLVVLKEPIAANLSEHVVPGLAEEHLQQSIAKIETLNKYDAEKSRREGALNNLESFLFDVKMKLEDEDEYKFAATETETESINKMVAELSDWLDDEGFSADAVTFENKLSELKSLTKPVWKRVKEARERPEAIAALRSTVNGSRNFLSTIKNMTASQTVDEGDPPMFTQIEFDTLEKVINETENWLEKMIVDQGKLKPSESPALTVKSLVDRMSSLDREVKYLVNKAKIWRPKVKKEEPAKDKNTTSSTKEKGEKSEDKPTESKKDEEKPAESKKDKEKPVKEPQEDEKSPPSVEEEHNTIYLDEETSEKSTTEKSEENVTEQPSTTETKTDETKHTEL
ncbi:hypoxia up-regulated protein 1 [Macrosteles quadrilineatus]|uniref:hypoxia up-regulated protein 1 n=1 Tax=Macrosteles quadrilineatus TaxID=74068 RepID=UPI0023E0BA2A|nr:hypoxia up-regulated protein 1 [Macrosteles quadrilineatus]XP_054262426.1 hypoxia up-regulated protein 1 [Macrosteles quadrilineatus]